MSQKDSTESPRTASLSWQVFEDRLCGGHVPSLPSLGPSPCQCQPLSCGWAHIPSCFVMGSSQGWGQGLSLFILFPMVPRARPQQNKLTVHRGEHHTKESGQLHLQRATEPVLVTLGTWRLVRTWRTDTPQSCLHTLSVHSLGCALVPPAPRTGRVACGAACPCLSPHFTCVHPCAA